MKNAGKQKKFFNDVWDASIIVKNTKIIFTLSP